MRKLITILIVLAMTFIIIKANAQGKGRGHGNGHAKHEWKADRGNSRHESHDRYAYETYDRASDRRAPYRPVYSHSHSHHCGHRIVVRHYEAPRYFYYSDYDMYFDRERNVYISYTGNGWNVSASLPVHIHHVDLGRVAYREVSYYDDDFVSYLGQGRPMYSDVVYSRR
jgi:hypothetical protein